MASTLGSNAGNAWFAQSIVAADDIVLTIDFGVPILGRCVEECCVLGVSYML